MTVAMHVGEYVLLVEDGSGLKKLTEAMSIFIFPLWDEEAKALYREGHKIGGLLSRQPSESTSIISTARVTK